MTIKPPEGPWPTPTLASLEMEVDYENDTLTIHAPADVQVVQRCTNDFTEGSSVIFRRRKPGVF
ncbi:hypothetical protein ADZZY_62 [Mycobacterium phage Adzzy]|uniref:hypothetical protein n=1 Tax=Mycobacterium phage Adzzy TaxID=1383059 RepID=UPI000387E1E1|nr:hypothetical protein ADZZY_62 [Mycobacterium phage Adzzy]AGT14310.1 hypothetical protein ADZZY_62 [Mycobacterium phage Adzzy]